MTEGGRQLWFPTLITSLCKYVGIGLMDSEVVTPVGHHITHSVISSYIKVSSEQEQGPMKGKSKSKPTPSHDASASMPSHPAKEPKLDHSDVNNIMAHLQYIKEHQRQHLLFLNAQMRLINKNQETLLRHNHLPVGDQFLPFDRPFDDDGYLLDERRNRADPSFSESRDEGACGECSDENYWHLEDEEEEDSTEEDDH